MPTPGPPFVRPSVLNRIKRAVQVFILDLVLRILSIGRCGIYAKVGSAQIQAHGRFSRLVSFVCGCERARSPAYP